MKRNVYGLIIITVILLMTIGCTTATSIINGIVSSVEAVLPFISQLSPSDQTLVTTYLNGATTITNTLLNCGPDTSACITTAVTQFNTLIFPALSASASPTVREILAAVPVAIAAFVAIEGLTGHTAKPQMKIPAAHMAKFKTRLTIIKTTLAVR